MSVLAFAGSKSFAQPALPASSPPPMPATSTIVDTNSSQTDPGAAKYMRACAGCHSVSGAKLTGPELSHVATWPSAQLKQAIKRMEKHVGALTEADLNALSEMLQDGQVRERLKAEQARIQAQFTAKMAPPNASLGRNLFFGRTPLINGGLACASCHSAAGEGANLGPDLTGIFAKMGETPLVSAIEKANFKMMERHYRDHPVTAQEAMHLAKYLSTLDLTQAAKTSAIFIPLGVGGAAATFLGLVFYSRSQRKGRDCRLQRRRQVL